MRTPTTSVPSPTGLDKCTCSFCRPGSCPFVTLTSASRCYVRARGVPHSQPEREEQQDRVHLWERQEPFNRQVSTTKVHREDSHPSPVWRPGDQGPAGESRRGARPEVLRGPILAASTATRPGKPLASSPGLTSSV